jgi:hypothetical protein
MIRPIAFCDRIAAESKEEEAEKWVEHCSLQAPGEGQQSGLIQPPKLPV